MQRRTLRAVCVVKVLPTVDANRMKAAFHLTEVKVDAVRVLSDAVSIGDDKVVGSNKALVGAVFAASIGELGRVERVRTVPSVSVLEVVDAV